MRDKVELKPAVYWDCPECNHRNYEIEEFIELTEEEKREFMEELEIPEAFAGGMAVDPIESVICVACTEQFDALYFDEEDHEDFEF
jgi:hypothetical protein